MFFFSALTFFNGLFSQRAGIHRHYRLSHILLQIVFDQPDSIVFQNIVVWVLCYWITSYCCIFMTAKTGPINLFCDRYCTYVYAVSVRFLKVFLIIKIRQKIKTFIRVPQVFRIKTSFHFFSKELYIFLFVYFCKLVFSLPFSSLGFYRYLEQKGLITFFCK